MNLARKSYTAFFGALYIINIVSQAIFTLAMPIGIGVLVSYLAVKFVSAPEWIYAPLIVMGAITGMISMIKFVLAAMAGYERLEKEQNEEHRNE